MRRLWYRFVFRLATDDNWRWLVLTGFTVVLLLVGIVLLPYALSQPETNYARAQRELYEFASQVRGAAVPYAGPGFFDSFLRDLSWIVWGLFGVSFVATIVYFFPAFGDDARRAVEAIRVRFWDRYGGEIRNRGFFTRFLLGENPPPGSNPPAAPATPAAGGTTGQTQPLTKGAFLFWEAIIDLINEFLGHALWGRR